MQYNARTMPAYVHRTASGRNNSDSCDSRFGGYNEVDEPSNVKHRHSFHGYEMGNGVSAKYKIAREEAECQSLAFVMIYDDQMKKWKPAGSGPGASRVCIYRHKINNTYRVVGRKEDGNHEVVINSSIHKNLKYNEATPTFHQWRDQRTVYGLNFQSKDDADNFSKFMKIAVNNLSGAPPPAPASNSTKQRSHSATFMQRNPLSTESVWNISSNSTGCISSDLPVEDVLKSAHDMFLSDSGLSKHFVNHNGSLEELNSVDNTSPVNSLGHERKNAVITPPSILRYCKSNPSSRPGSPTRKFRHSQPSLEKQLLQNLTIRKQRQSTCSLPDVEQLRSRSLQCMSSGYSSVDSYSRDSGDSTEKNEKDVHKSEDLSGVLFFKKSPKRLVRTKSQDFLTELESNFLKKNSSSVDNKGPSRAELEAQRLEKERAERERMRIEQERQEKERRQREAASAPPPPPSGGGIPPPPSMGGGVPPPPPSGGGGGVPPPPPSGGGGGIPPPPPSGGPPPPPSGGPPPASSGGGGGGGMGGLAAALAAAKLKKVEQPAEKPVAASSGGGGGGGGGDFMGELQKRMQRRAQQAESGGGGGGSSNGGSSAPATKIVSPIVNVAPKGPPPAENKRPWQKPQSTSSSTGSLNRTKSSGVTNGASAADLESIKQEIISEVREEIQKMKEEILTAIRQMR